MTYYSQCSEDKILFEKYLSKIKIENPVYLEMGAMDGISFSNTYFFEKNHGWTGILIEPHKKNFELLQQNRPNNKLFNNLISNQENEQEYINYETQCLSGVAGILNTMPKGNILTYYENDNEWQKNQREKYLKIDTIKPITLSKVIKESNFEKIDFFSLDVEGHEYNVLLSYDWTIPINMFLIENNEQTKEIRDLMTLKNYVYLENIGCNSFYVLKDFYDKYLSNI